MIRVLRKIQDVVWLKLPLMVGLTWNIDRAIVGWLGLFILLTKFIVTPHPLKLKLWSCGITTDEEIERFPSQICSPEFKRNMQGRVYARMRSASYDKSIFSIREIVCNGLRFFDCRYIKVSVSETAQHHNDLWAYRALNLNSQQVNTHDLRENLRNWPNIPTHFAKQSRPVGLILWYIESHNRIVL